MTTVDRTPIGKKYVAQLNKVNDQLSYSALVHQELEGIVKRKAQSNPKDYTVTIFATNPYAMRLHRRAEDLPAFAAQSKIIGFKTAIVAGYEHLAAYLEDIQSYRATLQPSPEDGIHEDAIEEQILLKLERWMPKKPEKGYFRTVGYLRHFRNSVAHAHEGPSPELSRYAATHAHALNEFWRNGVTKLNGLDFRTAPSLEMNSDTAFALMNLLRICLRQIDQAIASSLSTDAVLREAFNEVISRKPDLKISPRKIADKMQGAIAIGYGEKLAKSAVETSVAHFLASSHR